MTKHRTGRLRLGIAGFAALMALSARPSAHAQIAEERTLGEAVELVQAFTAEGDSVIPYDLLQRARGIAVIPKVFRGGFILGARRGRGVLVVRSENGTWSNPAFVTLTGGSIGWQIGAESTDLVLVFANDNAVKNITTGKFTLGGDASAVAGPLGKQATMAMTFRAEIYGYVRSRGLFAGAAFEGARLDIDESAGWRFYSQDARATPLAAQNEWTPAAARRFLLAMEGASFTPRPAEAGPAASDVVVTFPLE